MIKSIKAYYIDQNAWWKPAVTDLTPPVVGEEIFIYCPITDDGSGEAYGHLVKVIRVSRLDDRGWLIRHDLAERLKSEEK